MIIESEDSEEWGKLDVDWEAEVTVVLDVLDACTSSSTLGRALVGVI